MQCRVSTSAAILESKVAREPDVCPEGQERKDELYTQRDSSCAKVQKHCVTVSCLPSEVTTLETVARCSAQAFRTPLSPDQGVNVSTLVVEKVQSSAEQQEQRQVYRRARHGGA